MPHAWKVASKVEHPARSYVDDDRVAMHLQARVEAVERGRAAGLSSPTAGTSQSTRRSRRRQARNEAQVAANLQVRAWARVTAEEHRAEHLGCLRLRLVASVRGGGLRKRGTLGLAVWAREGEWRGQPGHRERHGRPGDVAAPLAAPDEGRLPPGTRSSGGRARLSAAKSVHARRAQRLRSSATSRYRPGGRRRAFGVRFRMEAFSHRPELLFAPSSMCLHGTGGCASCRDGK
jgi:hypothetical protein